MKELEKILEEVGKLKKICEANAFSLMDGGSLPCIYDKSDIEFAKGYAFSLAIKIIRKHMNDGWIPVEDRLPEDNVTDFYDLVMVTMVNGRVSYGFYRNADEEWWVASKDGEFEYVPRNEVIAWRPLPEPYIPERNDNHDRE